MQNPNLFYKKQISLFSSELERAKKQLFHSSLLRFLAFVTTALGIYFTFYNAQFMAIIGIVGISIFIFLVIKHANLQRKKQLIEAKLNINLTEIDVLKGNFHQLETGKEFINPLHYFSNDIDLFGVGSFFQYINRTATNKGKTELATILTANCITEINKKQQALKELATKVKWRQHFSAVASLVSSKITIQSITKWIVNYQSKLPKYLSVISKVFSIISIIIIGLLIFKIVSFSVILSWFFVGLTLTGFQLKNIQKLYSNAGNAKETFNQYHLLLEQIENQTFTASILKDKQTEIQSERKKASVIFKEFSKILDAFDQRNNILIALVGNGLFLWDIRNALKTEQWIATYKNTVKKWFEVVGFFDAQNSLSNFVYNHPHYAFPKIHQEKTIVSSENLGHPLLNPKKRIDNDFLIDNGQFFIITGANMAGKSTFLRTISLSIVMANCGLPVCANHYKYNPIKLITSMRTSDSLTDNESYFYSELKRLKFIVDKIKTDKYFIILDEILKGTNSKDKAIGSKKFVEKLTNSKSTGIIATHDVSLCELATEYSQIKNYYFDAEIINNELHFDYKMKSGICKNMNASFLLTKMEIV